MTKIVYIIVFTILAVNNAFSASWYVDNAIGSSGNGQSWSSAWKSFSNIVWGSTGVQAGDTLYISGGATSKTYSASGNNMLMIGSSGTSSARVTIATGAKSPSPTGHDGKVIFNGGGSYQGLINCSNRSNITLDGEKAGMPNWTLQNTLTSDSAAAAIDAGSAHSLKVTYLTITNIGMAVNATYANAIEISYCNITGVTTDCAIRNIASNTSATSYGQSKIHHNNIQTNTNASSGAGPDGIQSGKSSDIYNNSFSSAVGTVVGAQHPDFVQSAGQYHRIFNNTFRNPIDSAIDVDAGWNWDNVFSNFRVYNNVFTSDSTSSAGASWPSGVRVYNGTYSTVKDVIIANNSFVDLRGDGSNGGRPLHITPPSNISIGENVIIKNNLFFNAGGGGFGVVDITTSNASAAQWGFDYNLINAGAHGSTALKIDGVEYTQAHPRTSAPAFLRYSPGYGSNDYHLAAGDMAAKGQGVDLSVFFTSDKDGYPRNGSWNIGAFQEAGSGVGSPTGLKIIGTSN